MPDDKKVDESWKEKAKSDKDPPAPSEAPKASPIPADFSSLVVSLATGAFMALGVDPEEEAKPRPPDLPRARWAIDLLEVLAVKTKGNLVPAEDRQLSALLHQLRLAYVEISRRAAKP